MRYTAEKYDFRLPVEGSRKVVIHLIQDEDAQNPRTEYDNVGTMVCWHGHYQLGDEQPSVDSETFLRQLACAYDQKLEDFIFEQEDEERINARVQRVLDQHYLILPLYLYDHSGISMSTTSFMGRAQHATWDSGTVGLIYCTREKALEEWGGKGKRLTKQVREQALQYLKGEVETYDQYLRGDVYGYQVKRKGEVLDSCWGYYGLETAKVEAEHAAQRLLSELLLKETQAA